MSSTIDYHNINPLKNNKYFYLGCYEKMRIVSGKYKNKRLQAPKGHNTRPTSDKIRAALFNILNHANWHASDTDLLDGAFILDLFAGTGALGLEALSRGGEHLIAVETDREAFQILTQNTQTLNCHEQTQIFTWDATTPKKRPPNTPARTLVFIDPPYRQGLGATALTAFAEADWLKEGAICIIEAAKNAPESVSDPAFDQIDHRIYGDTTLTIYRYSPKT